jgi:hypothetical protein
MSEPVLHKADIEDAETWIAKAILLGAVIKQHQKDINPHAWRYYAVVTGKQIVAAADWPGRVAKDIVERIQKYEEDERNACM